MTVSERFLLLSLGIQPLPYSLEKIDGHKATVKARLEASFDLSKIILIGSMSRSTAIRSASDVDLLTVFSRSEVRWGSDYVNSNTLVDRVRKDLSDRYKSTSIRKDSQAVVIEFSQGDRSFDVVPGYYHDFLGVAKTPVYRIPDGFGGWLETAPEAHGRYLVKANETSNGKLRRTVQFIKHWRSSRSSPIRLSSIYVELFLASRGICSGVKSYSQCLHDAFSELHRSRCVGLVDPVGVAGTLFAAQTKPQLESLQAAVAYAFEHATKAREAEIHGKTSEAIRQWDIVFNGQF